MTYSKTACHAVIFQAAAGARLYFRPFPANTNNSLAFAAWQVLQITNLSPKLRKSYFFPGLKL